MTQSVADPQRIVSLAGGVNFRDIGGYRTADGRALAWGKIFRTGVLSYFTDADTAPLRQLGVRAICDLRRRDERDREPTRWPDTDARQLIFDDGDAPPTIRVIATRYPNTAAGMHDAMVQLYRELPDWLGPRINAMFAHLAEGNVPMIVHCAAGKDRTGIAIALLLTVLGVPRDVIVHDYLLTNETGNFETFIATRRNAQLGLATALQPLFAMPADVRTVLFSAHADFLQGAFDQIATNHGSVAAYLDHHGVDAALRSAVAERLLGD